MPSAKQQPSNVKHGGAIRPNVWVLTFGPACIKTTNGYIAIIFGAVFCTSRKLSDFHLILQV